MASTTPAQRVERWRTQYGDVRWDVAEANAPRDAALAAGSENALDCLADGSAGAAEAAVWVSLAQLVSFKYRRIAR